MFSPCANAADGAVGVSSASTCVKCLGEVAQDQRPHLLRAQVVGVVIAGRQHVGADHDAPPNLGAESRRAGALIQIAQIFAVLTQAEAHAVIACEVGRRLGGRDDVIGGQAVFRVRQRNVDDLGAGVAQPGSALLPQRLDFLRHAVGRGIRAARRCAGPCTPRAQAAAIIRHRHIGAGGILRVVPRHGTEQDRRNPAPCGQTAPDGPATRRTPPRPSASSAHRSASSRRCRRTMPADGSSRRCRCRSLPSPAAPPPRPPSRRTNRRAPAPRRVLPALPRVFHRPVGARSCWTSPWRTRPCWSCPGTPRRRAADWR